MRLLALCCALPSSVVAVPGAAGSKPHIVSVLQDDLGFYDTGMHNPAAAAYTQNITALAKQGIVLMNHYVHWHCSPTRRSFLTGRLPIHHGEQLSADNSDDIDLRMSWVSDKLARAGYSGHWFGKWHTGFQSMHHLGMHHGFNTSVGSFQTGGAYSGPSHSMRWENDHPIYDDAQFSNKPGSDAARGGRVCGAGGPDGRDTSASGAASGAACNATIYTDSLLQCGSALKFTAPTTADECCAQCAALTGCDHWVFQPLEKSGPCHLKTDGQHCQPNSKNGSTAGIMKSSSPPMGGADCANEYSTDLWGELALQSVQQHSLPTPFYLHLCFQAVHTPYDQAPGDPTSSIYRGMVWRADVYMGELVRVLHERQMWTNLFLVYSADNGGVGSGVNYPLRGEKHSNWEGGLRTAAFVSGGLVPPALRGTNNTHNFHVVDWYATFSVLAGQPASDDPPVPPKQGDTSRPYDNIYGEESFPPLDGVDIWPMLMQPEAHPIDAAHKHLVLTKEVLVAANYKLLVSQPFFKTQNNGWKTKDGAWSDDNNGIPLADCVNQDVSPQASFFPVPHNSSLRPCLFDLRNDPEERHDLSTSLPAIVDELWAVLNETILTTRDCTGWTYKGTIGEIPGPIQPANPTDPEGTTTTSCSPAALKGPCDKLCADTYWEKNWLSSSHGSGSKGTPPQCGVPGCGN